MIFGWKKNSRNLPASFGNPRRFSQIFSKSGENSGPIRFENVSLSNSIHSLSLEIPMGGWVVLYGEDDFAKALFCDLCFSYIQPESGKVHPALKGSDVSFLGRSNTTYGNSLVDHLSSGVTESSKELMEIAVDHVLSRRFHRLLAKSKLQFLDGRRSQDLDLDERDFLELAEANVILQRKSAVVIDTTSDFYHIALEQGFRHSETLLRSQKTLLWIVDEKYAFPSNATPWREDKFTSTNKISLSFPLGSRAGYIN